MNKREADTILLACKKHGISLTMRKEGDVYMVTFINRIEIKSFDGAKLITNGLVVEGRLKKDIKKHVVELGSSVKLNFLTIRQGRRGMIVGLAGVKDVGRINYLKEGCGE